MSLSPLEKGRYERQIILGEIGEQGQEKIKEATVLVVGAGGLGAPVLQYLVAAGVGHIGIIDDDRVSLSNLQRQVLYDTTDLNRPKVLVAKEKLLRLNPECRITTWECRLTAENAEEIFRPYRIIVDATDNLPTRYLMDEQCAQQQKPLVYGSICEFNGQVSVFHYQGGPSFRDLYPYPEDISTFTQPTGIIGPLPGVIGSLQATEVIKIILGHPGVLSGKLLVADLLEMRFFPLTIGK